MKVGVRTVLEAGIPESLKLSRLLLLTEAGKPECPRAVSLIKPVSGGADALQTGRRSGN